MPKVTQTKRNASQRNAGKAHAVKYGSRGKKYKPKLK